MAADVLDAFDCVDAIFVGEAEISFAAFLERCRSGRIDFENFRG